MDFTREPIIETIITPKEGCKIVVRSSKNAGQEEYFVDALEVVSFGNALFFRSLERPKSFLVPASDYEILEVREARMVLKNVGLDRSIKIGGGREATMKPSREPSIEKMEAAQMPMEEEPVISSLEEETVPAEKTEGRSDKKRDRRRHYRRRRGREEPLKEEGEVSERTDEEGGEEKISLPEPQRIESLDEKVSHESILNTPSIITTLLPPPPTLISETIARYKANDMFRGAFFVKEEQPAVEENAGKETDESHPLEGIEEEAVDTEMAHVLLEEPHATPFEIHESEEDEEVPAFMPDLFQEFDHEESFEEPSENEEQETTLKEEESKHDSIPNENQHN